MQELKRKIAMSGITRKELAKKIGVPYGTLTGYLNDFVPMPEHIKIAIEEVLKNNL